METIDSLEDLLTELRRRAARLAVAAAGGPPHLSLVRPPDPDAKIEESLPEQEPPDLQTSA